MSQPSWIGKQIGGRYQIEALLGQGGMSSVFKGTDPNLRRQVAVKLIHPHLSQDNQFVSRFEEEAAAVARLKHPNIIQVYDFDHDEGTYYMVLEYVPGETLQQRLRRLAEAGDRMPLAEAIAITVSICDALHYAHERDMIHRDIKPANIMINEQGQAVLMDFGVAKIIGGKQHTATGAVVGTPTYISPEQVRGLDLDRRVDIYSLGITLFEMLSGHPPFEADSALTTMMMHVNEPLPDIQELNPGLANDVVAIVEKALEKNRENRFSTTAEMAEALRGADLTAATVRDEAPDDISSAPVTLPPQARNLEAPVPASAQSGANMVSSAPPAGAVANSQSGVASDDGRRRGMLAGGAVIIVIVGCLVALVGGYFLLNQFGGGAAIAAATDTPTPLSTLAPSQMPTDAPPTVTSEPTIAPSPTEPRGPYVRINGISQQSGRYIVDYETFGYIENLPGQHVHFFFDTVPPEQAGVPGSGPWYVWGGPRPFNGYSVNERPAEASQLCTLSANPDHSVVPDSGNCVDLPEG